MSTGLPILEMRGIKKSFGGVHALRDVSLAVERGEVHAICGENGAGKSTLMKVLSGVHPAGTYEGEIHFEGAVCQFRNIRASEDSGIVIIHQELALSPYLSIAENIFLGNEKASRGVIDWTATHRDAAELLARVGLDEHSATPVMDIGVGKQQLVEIAKALSKEVKLLILDEPTAALNDEDSEHLLDLIRDLKRHGITCILISHKLNEVASIADRVTVLRDGQTIETLDMRGDEPVSEGRIIRGMVGREMDQRFPDHTPTVGSEALRIEDWTVHHPLDPTRVMVNRANIDVQHGEIIGLAGLMGAGRTELAMSVFGQCYGSHISGRLFKDGREIQARSVSEAIGHRLAYVTEDRKHLGLNLVQSIRENLSLVGLGLFALHGVIDSSAERASAESFRRSLAIKTRTVEVPVATLSGGNQQKVVLGKWILTDPDVLILDEPTRGIDVGAKYEIYQIINELADDGKAVIVISSELPELLGMCDRIYALSQGRITGQLSRAEATQERLMHLMTLEKEAVTP